jgi:hypothetical protein
MDRSNFSAEGSEERWLLRFELDPAVEYDACAVGEREEMGALVI